MTAAAYDGCAKPSSAIDEAEAVSQSSDDSDVEEIPPPAARDFGAAGSSAGAADFGAAGSTSAAAANGIEDDEDDEDVQISSLAAAPKDGEDDEDVQVMGHTGAIALADFPHARENCAAVRFTAGQEHTQGAHADGPPGRSCRM